MNVSDSNRLPGALLSITLILRRVRMRLGNMSAQFSPQRKLEG